jgi:hypothetical protein
MLNYQQATNNYGQLNQNYPVNSPGLSNMGSFSGAQNYYQNQNSNFNNFQLQKNIGLPFNMLSQPVINANLNSMNQMNPNMNFSVNC